MTKHILLIFDRDWADEFTTSGFHVMTELEWEGFKKQAKEAFESMPKVEKVINWSTGEKAIVGQELEWYFGTNEFHQWATYEDWLKDIKVEPITDALAATLKSVFNRWMNYGFGIIPYEIQGMEEY